MGVRVPPFAPFVLKDLRVSDDCSIFTLVLLSYRKTTDWTLIPAGTKGVSREVQSDVFGIVAPLRLKVHPPQQVVEARVVAEGSATGKIVLLCES